MLKHSLLLLFCYLLFVWQAALRPDLAWQGHVPHFLALALVAVLWSLTDAQALVAAALLGLLSDSLAPRGLGNDMLCFLAVGICLQALCPPRLVRHPGWMLVLVLLATVLIEVSTWALRATLNHEIPAAEVGSAAVYLRLGVTALGDGIYTAMLAVLPLFCVSLWTRRRTRDDGHAATNRWHRLTS